MLTTGGQIFGTDEAQLPPYAFSQGEDPKPMTFEEYFFNCGHRKGGDNDKYTPDGHRRCRTCYRRLKNRSRRERQRLFRENRVLVNGKLFSPDCPEASHGTCHGYENYGCRCTPCGNAQRAYRRDHRSK